MKSKITFFIVLVSAIIQGHGMEVTSSASITSSRTEQFTSFVGQSVSRSIEVSFSTAELPPDPNEPVVSMNNGNSNTLSFDWEYVNLRYGVSIDGDDSLMFSAKVTNSSSTSNSCTVSITYSPTSAGVHSANLIVGKIGVQKQLLIKLMGSASSLPGDVNCDGKVDISDVTNLIDVILNGGEAPGGDVNGDGKVDISDVTKLIDLILNGPSVMYYPTLLVTTTDGVTVEYLIDENTKLKIQKPDLIIETGGMVLNYSLENMAHLRYGQREVSSQSILQNFTIPRAGDVYIHGSQDNNAAKVICANDTIIKEATNDGSIAVSLGSAPSGEYEIKAESQTIKVLKP